MHFFEEQLLNTLKDTTLPLEEKIKRINFSIAAIRKIQATERELYAGFENLTGQVLGEEVHCSVGVNVREDNNNTALICAASGHPEIIEILIQNGLLIDAQNNQGSTALICAASYGVIENVRLLIKAKANLEIEDEKLRTALYFAAGHGHLEIVQLLIEKGAAVDGLNPAAESALNVAARSGHVDVVNQLILAGANVNNPGFVTPPLINAIANGQTLVAAILIQARAGVDLRDGYHRTPLMIAAKQGDIKTVDLLIKANCNLDAQNSYYKDTALIIAVKNKQFLIAQKIIEAKANLELKNSDGDTAIDIAWETDYKIACLLVSSGANLSKYSFQYSFKNNVHQINVKNNYTEQVAVCAQPVMLMSVLFQYGVVIQNPQEFQQFLNSQKSNEKVLFCQNILYVEQYKKLPSPLSGFHPGILHRRLGRHLAHGNQMEKAVAHFIEAFHLNDVCISELVTLAQELLVRHMKSDELKSSTTSTVSAIPNIFASLFYFSSKSIHNNAKNQHLKLFEKVMDVIYVFLTSHQMQADLTFEQWHFLAQHAMGVSSDGVSISQEASKKMQKMAATSEEKQCVQEFSDSMRTIFNYSSIAYFNRLEAAKKSLSIIEEYLGEEGKPLLPSVRHIFNISDVSERLDDEAVTGSVNIVEGQSRSTGGHDITQEPQLSPLRARFR